MTKLSGDERIFHIHLAVLTE